MQIDWANISVGVAAILGLIYVVREIRGMVGDNGRMLLSQATVLREIAVALGVLGVKTDRLHDDNVENALLLKMTNAKTAATLKAADDNKVRKVKDEGNGRGQND